MFFLFQLPATEQTDSKNEKSAEIGPELNKSEERIYCHQGVHHDVSKDGKF